MSNDPIRDSFAALTTEFLEKAAGTTDAQEAQRWMTAAAIAFDKSQRPSSAVDWANVRLEQEFQHLRGLFADLAQRDRETPEAPPA